MTGKLVIVWIVLISLPLLPVVILYLIFETQNYFSLEQTAKGIVATGPIAAYVALVWLGWRIYSQLSRSSIRSSAALRQVLGRWHFEATSGHGTRRSGECTITNPSGILEITGNFIEDGKPVGTWSSAMAQLEESRLSVVYHLTETRDGAPQSTQALCVVDFDPKRVSPMTGRWTVIGVANAAGEIVYTKRG